MRGGATDVWKVTDDRGEVFVAKVFPACIGEDHKIKVASSLADYNRTTQFHSRGTTKSSRCGSG